MIDRDLIDIASSPPQPAPARPSRLEPLARACSMLNAGMNSNVQTHLDGGAGLFLGFLLGY